ncbi:A24 family peptidase C-terminal domain-containing protein [Methanobacterium alcaliphilum]|uniref:A24 family peptidase C-terminal domain-containing protein n=1 Tax=Methanobacterium alcaliphilum TaxID=392018 RepID=UPI002009FA23|nr:A24 family peptidase C-terminal domain-containing protein [Methanobacterium alcaliphilum]MCK9150659.1 prepilin peptidase [Methanobacterium alcaliphilum]
MISYIALSCTFIAIIACFYASYSDLKKGIIPNKLTFPLIGIGILLNGINAFILGNIMILVYTLLFTGTIFVLGYAFWKLGAWAGGDVKLFTALAAILPFQPLIVNYTFLNTSFPILAYYPFPFTLIINSILSTFPFLLLFVFYIAYNEKRHLISELTSPVKDYKKNMVLALVVTSSVTITVLITPFLPFQILILSLILIYLLTMTISRLPNRVKAVLVSIVTVYAIYKSFELAITGIVVVFISITIIGIIRKLLTSVNRQALQDDLEVDKLRDGMIMAHCLYEKDDKVFFDDSSMFSGFKKAAKTGDISTLTAPKGKLLIGNLAAGLTDENIDLLKDMVSQKKLENKFRVKRGVPFAPSIFIGLLISLFIGDLALIFFQLVQLLV